MRSFINIFILFISIFIFSCDSGPKVIQANETAPPMSGDGAMTNPHNHPMTGTGAEETHKVVAKEVMDTDKYSYIRVEENGNEFWIAVSKRDIKIGDTYFYKGGLLKKNFYSREFDKEFETVYLVSNLSQQPVGTPGSGSAVDQALNKINGGGAEAVDLSVDDIQPSAGSVPISELLKNKAQYAGKSVKVTGKVVKINPMIMGRNWVHLIDASVDGADLTITTQEPVPVGAIVSLEGTIALDKDFGAGYRYDIIMENAELK